MTAGIYISKAIKSEYGQKIVQVSKGAIKSVIDKTDYGHKILNGREEAAKALVTEFTPPYLNVVPACEKYKELIAPLNAVKTVSAGLKEKETVGLILEYVKEKGFNVDDVFKGLSENDTLKFFLEKIAVGPNKLLQIISSDESILSKLPSKIKSIAQKSRSENSPTRTLGEVQALLEKSHPGYKADKLLGVGTIGEAYLIRDSFGREFVLKTIKKGVDFKSLKIEEELFVRYAKNGLTDKKKAKEVESVIRSLYKGWAKETDFKVEYAYNKLLAQDAKRFQVADIIDISKDAKSVIYEKAEGIQLDKFVELYRNYLKDPNGFTKKYAELIEQNPWLKDPKAAIDNGARSLLGAFNEMNLFLKNGERLLYGDAHGGNIFLNNGKITFIDTGNCVLRQAKDIKEDTILFTNYLFGNGKGMVECILKRAKSIPNDVDKGLLTQKLGEYIDRNIFGRIHNITDFERLNKVLKDLMEVNGISIDPDCAAAVKAQTQFLKTVNELFTLQGKRVNMAQTMKDLPRAFIQMYKNNANITAPVKKALKEASQNPEKSSRTAFQFLFRPTSVKNKVNVAQ